MTEAKQIRNLIDTLEGKNTELEEGFLSNLWDKVKAAFGSNEAAGRVAAMNAAKRMRAAFRKFVGPRREQITTDDDFNKFLYNWLTNTLNYDPRIIQKAAQANNFTFKANNTNNTNKVNSDVSTTADKKDAFAPESVQYSLRNYLGESTLMEDIGMGNSDLDKFFVTCITMAQDANMQPEFVQQALKQEYQAADQKMGGSGTDSVDSSEGSKSSNPSSTDTTTPKENLDTLTISKKENLDTLTISKKEFSKNLKDTQVNLDIKKMKGKAKSGHFSDLVAPGDNGEQNPLGKELAAVGFSFLRSLDKK